jgi:hypothetical protein
MPYVSILWRVLFVLMTLRLLAPPGICLCKSTGPLLLWLGTTPVTEEPTREDDHEPGCPASPLSAGMYLKPSGVPLHPPLTFDHPPQAELPLCQARLLLPAPGDDVPVVFERPPRSALYLSLLTLRI